MQTLSLLIIFSSTLFTLSNGFLAPQNPPPQWGSGQWNLSLSTISMFCNQSGWLPTRVAASFGIPSVDWSNSKDQWAKALPMDDSERLMDQGVIIKAANPASHVFLYQNTVKALPWMSEVRAKLVDPQYEGFFLKFKEGGSLPNGSYHVPNCDTNYDPPLCSIFYHDQLQTPQYPGQCASPGCDCGGVPSGEYLFNYRNGSQLIDFLIEEVIFGPTKLGSPIIDGLFLDDFWCSNIVNGTGNCNDPVQGPTEIDKNSQVDMGLSDEDIADITRGWLDAFTQIQSTILKRGKYTWSLIPGQENANASPRVVTINNCVAELTEACQATNPWLKAPLMHGVTFGENSTLPSLDADLAAFLLMRGPWAWTGAGYWGMSWPTGATWNTNNTPAPRPPQFEADYGLPIDDTCSEISTGIFQRKYQKSTIVLDCKSYTATGILLS